MNNDLPPLPKTYYPGIYNRYQMRAYAAQAVAAALSERQALKLDAAIDAAIDRARSKMTRDDIIRMMREAGFTVQHDEQLFTGIFERFATIVLAANMPEVAIAEAYRYGEEAGRTVEREACADICDQHASAEGIAQRCAEAIRARSKE